VSGGAAETQAARVEKPAEMRWRAVCQYVGTQLEGWQAQPSKRAVQDFLEKRLAQIFGRQIRIHGSGRTDSGVHARGQVFHFDADWKHGPEKLERAIATGLPDAIQIRGLRRAQPDFHARFSATGKRYVYFLHRGRADPFDDPFCWSLGGRPLDVEAMRAAARLLVGRHDFRAFSAFNGEEREDTVKTLRRLDVLGRGQKLRIVAEADGFLYKMVRTLVGALVGVGLGKLKPEQVAALLDGRKRTHLVETAPAQGLFLWRVEYGRKR
jgi:tRNA pseudouridine38-40 synthase